MGWSSKINFFFLIIVLIVNLQCIGQSRDYKSQLNIIPQFLVEHFPEELHENERSRFITNTDTTNNCISYILVEYGENATQRFKNDYLRFGDIVKYNADDSNIVTIIRDGITYWNPEKKRYYTDSIQNWKKYLPIPFFEKESESVIREPKGIYSDSTYSGLTDDFIIYVYDFKVGKYWNGLKPQDYMPKGWKNGYSRGGALSENKKVAIYWFVVW